MKTLLAIGDTKDFDSFKKFFRQRKLFKKYNFYFKSADYDSALKGKLPELVELKDIKTDFHVHSKYSDGGNSIYDNAQAAKKKAKVKVSGKSVFQLKKIITEKAKK